jgi:hypothetical protein
LRVLSPLNGYFLRRRTSVEWKLSIEERRALRALISSPGWKLFSVRLKELEADSLEFLLATNQVAELLHRKGQLEGIQKASSLVESLSSHPNDGGDESWQARLERRVDEEFSRVQAILSPDSLEVEERDLLRQRSPAVEPQIQRVEDSPEAEEELLIRARRGFQSTFSRRV